MAQQIEVDPQAVTGNDAGEGVIEIAPDLPYRRVGSVNILLAGAPGGSFVRVDAGLPGTKRVVQHAVEARFGKGARPSAIGLTHGHIDHVGALEQLAAEWDVPIYAHVQEHPYLNGTSSYPPPDAKVGGGLMAVFSKLFPRSPIDVKRWLHALPEDGSVPGMPGWRWLHTPGHAAGHVSLWRESDRALIAGDAFVTTAQESLYSVITQKPELHGPPMYFTPDWQAARVSVEKLAALKPALAVTGHGRAMAGPALTEALDHLARDFEQVAVPKYGSYVAEPARAQDGTAYR